VNNEDYPTFVIVFSRMKLVLDLPSYIRAVPIYKYSSVIAISLTGENMCVLTAEKLRKYSQLIKITYVTVVPAIE